MLSETRASAASASYYTRAGAAHHKQVKGLTAQDEVHGELEEEEAREKADEAVAEGVPGTVVCSVGVDEDPRVSCGVRILRALQVARTHNGGVADRVRGQRGAGREVYMRTRQRLSRSGRGWPAIECRGGRRP